MKPQGLVAQDILTKQLYTVQEYLLVRVIFGEFVCKKQLADFILAEFLQF